MPSEQKVQNTIACVEISKANHIAACRVDDPDEIVVCKVFIGEL
jgi:hypothetical protein